MRQLLSTLCTFLLVFSFMSCESKQTKKEENKNILSELDSINLENSKSIIASGDNITKAYILKDSLLYLTADMKKDHRIFGYEKPDLTSKKTITFFNFHK